MYLFKHKTYHVVEVAFMRVHVLVREIYSSYEDFSLF